MENIFKSIETLVGERLPLMKHLCRFVLGSHWPNIDRVQNISRPILFIYGDEDEVVKNANSIELNSKASKSIFKELHCIPEGDHAYAFRANKDKYIKRNNEEAILPNGGITPGFESKANSPSLPLVLIDENGTKINAYFLRELTKSAGKMIEIGQCYYFQNGDVKFPSSKFIWRISLIHPIIAKDRNEEILRSMGVKPFEEDNKELKKTEDIIEAFEKDVFATLWEKGGSNPPLEKLI